MLLDLYYKYEQEGIVSLPGFKAFVLKKYPKEYGDLVDRMMCQDSEFEKVKVLIEGDLTTRDLQGDLNTKATERILKKYHGYNDTLNIDVKTVDKCYLPLKDEDN